MGEKRKGGEEGKGAGENRRVERRWEERKEITRRNWEERMEEKRKGRKEGDEDKEVGRGNLREKGKK